MDIVTGIIKLLFGSKADKDRKAIEPYVNKIKEVYPSIAALSNDELRGRSQALMKQIADFIAPDEERIVTLKAQLERAETALEEKEKISKEIDEITKRIDEKIEQKLDEILPEAFAIMKDTARRFAENETVTVTANDFDRQLAASKDFVTIDGDKAVYATHWLAGGNDVKWDMVHYDVQLFGGVVLHQGKIAEIISAKSGERREIFEEAAGIVKFKARKEEADKKLQRTLENLERVDDILDELTKRLKPLEEQSRNARVYLELSTEPKYMEEFVAACFLPHTNKELFPSSVQE